MIPDSEIKRIAEAIMWDAAQDIEYLTVAEVTSALLEAAEWPIETIDEEEAIWLRVDAMVKKAKVTITFDED